MKPITATSKLPPPMRLFAYSSPGKLVFWWFSVIFFLLCSCKKEALLPNERQGITDLSNFIFGQIVKYGGSNVPAKRLSASGTTNYFYSEDNYGCQIVCMGNEVSALCTLLQSEFGTPALSTTNASGLASFVYAISQTGVAINCGLDNGIIQGAKQQVTHLVLLRQGALK